jgi:hypothetical protein
MNELLVVTNFFDNPAAVNRDLGYYDYVLLGSRFFGRDGKQSHQRASGCKRIKLRECTTTPLCG